MNRNRLPRNRGDNRRPAPGNQPVKKNHIRRKRENTKPVESPNDVYVSRNTNFKCDLERLEKLWIAGEQKIIVRAMGAAIPRTINLALQFNTNHFDAYEIDVSTGTEEMIDDFEPVTDDVDYETNCRNISSITIKLIRKEEKEKLKEKELASTSAEN